MSTLSEFVHMPARTILFIDDDPGVLKTAELLLKKAGHIFRAALNPAEAFGVLASEPVDAILLDLNFSRAQMSGEEGLACLQDILLHDPRAVVIVVTGHSGLTIAVQALRAGAKNFVMKPWNNERLLEVIEEAIAQHGNAEIRARQPESIAKFDTGMIVGACDAIMRTKELILRFAPLTASVLLVGESGTGKSQVAHALHRQSGRAELKVWEASTLEVRDLVELSNTTVVLENVDGLDPSLTQPLIAWLQTANRNNARVVATTCRGHSDMGIQRALFYALSTLEMGLPALRDRGNDVELLSNHFARAFALSQGLPPPTLMPAAMVALRGAEWPDNLHALRRVVERAVVAVPGSVVTAADLDLPRDQAATAATLGLNLERTEKLVIEEALSRHNFNISKAAIELGLTRQTLYRRMVRHGL